MSSIIKSKKKNVISICKEIIFYLREICELGIIKSTMKMVMSRRYFFAMYLTVYVTLNVDISQQLDLDKEGGRYLQQS